MRRSYLKLEQMGHRVIAAHSIGPVDLIRLNLPAGEFSERVQSELLIMKPLNPVRVNANLGHGRWSSWVSKNRFGVSSPMFDNMIVVDQDYRLDVLSVPWNAIKNADVEARLPRDGDFMQGHDGVHEHPLLDKWMAKMWSDGEAGSGLEIETKMAQLIELLGWFCDRKSSETRNPAETLSSQIKRRCLEYLDHHSHDVGLAELAGIAALSPAHFCRAFKATVGLPPHRYQMLRRLERARKLLGVAHQSIADIGVSVGYDDAAYFSRIFRRETGITPGQWRSEVLGGRTSPALVRM